MKEKPHDEVSVGKCEFLTTDTYARLSMPDDDARRRGLM